MIREGYKEVLVSASELVELSKDRISMRSILASTGRYQLRNASKPVNSWVNTPDPTDGRKILIYYSTIPKQTDANDSLNHNGFILNRERFIATIEEKPNVDAIKQLLNRQVFSTFNGYDIKTRGNLLSLTNGVVSKVANADSTLTTEFTYHTKTDSSAQLATALLNVADALTLYITEHGYYCDPDFVNLPGLLFYKGQKKYILDLGFIRGFEVK